MANRREKDNCTEYLNQTRAAEILEVKPQTLKAMSERRLIPRKADYTRDVTEFMYCADHINVLKKLSEFGGAPSKYNQVWLLSMTGRMINSLHKSANERQNYVRELERKLDSNYTEHMKSQDEQVERQFTWLTEADVLDFADELPVKLNANLPLSAAAKLLNTSSEEMRELLSEKHFRRYRSGFCSQELIEYGKNMGGRFISYRSVYTEVAQEDWQMYPSGEIFGERIVVDGQVVRDTYSECFPDVYSCAYPEDPKFREWEKVMMGSDLYTFLSDREISF